MISKQEEIKEGMVGMELGTEESGVLHYCLSCEDVDKILSYLHSEGLGFRGLPLGASHPHLSEYFTFEPLIGEAK